MGSLRTIPNNSTDLLYSPFPAERLIRLTEALGYSDIKVVTTATLNPERALFHAVLNGIQTFIRIPGANEEERGLAIDALAEYIYKNTLQEFLLELEKREDALKLKKEQATEFCNQDLSLLNAEDYSYRWQRKAIETYATAAEPKIVNTVYWALRNLEYKHYRDAARGIIENYITINFPNRLITTRKVKDRRYIIVFGAMGSGKTFLTQDILRAQDNPDNFVLHNADYLKPAIFNQAKRDGILPPDFEYKGPEVQNESSNALYERVRKGTHLARKSGSGPDVIVNSIVLGDFELEEGTAAGGSVIAYHVNISPEDAREDNKKRKRQAGDTDVSWSNAASAKSIFNLKQERFRDKDIIIYLLERKTGTAPKEYGAIDNKSKIIYLKDREALTSFKNLGATAYPELGKEAAAKKFLLELNASGFVIKPGKMPPEYIRNNPFGYTYPAVRPSDTIVINEQTSQGLEAALSQLHDGSFGNVVNSEIRRLDGYYRACSNWLNDAAKAHKLAETLNFDAAEYKHIAEENNFISHRILMYIENIALQSGISKEAIEEIKSTAKLINVKDVARQRMLMMRSVLHATPVIMRDPFNGAKATSEYGFTDGKASIGNVRFSAVASPRLHGYVFRFAVCQNSNDGWTDNNPGMIIDTRVMDALDSYHDKEDIYNLLSLNLYPNIHDWVHSWLLYDVRAKSASFQQWGADIFFNVEHLIDNNLVINYELLSMSMHRYVWNTIIDIEPSRKTELVSNLQEYVRKIKIFSDWYAKNHSETSAAKMEEYLFYVVASNLCFVLNPNEPEFAEIFEQYPAAHEKLRKIMGKTLDMLHGNLSHIPSQQAPEEGEEVQHYIIRYPLEDEIAAKLKAERIGKKTGDTLNIPAGRIYTENLRAYEKLPPEIKEQLIDIKCSDTFAMLNEALDRIPEDKRKYFIERIKLDEDGRMFFRIERDEIDLTSMTVKKQDKTALLVEIPNGTRFEIHPRVRVNLLGEIKRQKTTLTDKDVIAFNLTDDASAHEIIRAGSLSQMVAKAKELANYGIEGADDIYPLSKKKAEEIYNFDGTGFYKCMGRKKHIATSPGPLIMRLQDGSDQKLFDGVVVYIPFKDDAANPDIHFTEAKDHLRAFPSAGRLSSIQGMAIKDKEIMPYLNQLLKALCNINRVIDHGANAELSAGVF